MTVAELLTRARAACGLDIGYALGATPGRSSVWPQDDNGNCDCSGFVAWCLGFSKYQPGFAWLKALNGGWLNTDGMYADLLQPTGLFAQCEAKPGAIVVYPAAWSAVRYSPTGKSNPKVGHVGIVSKQDPAKVIHCSAGNARETGSAIAETSMAVFMRASVVGFGWYAGLEPPKEG